MLLWAPCSAGPVRPARPAADDDESLPELSLMEVIPPRCDADAVVQLSGWRRRVASTAPGATLARVLQHRPGRIPARASDAHRMPLWANALLDSLAARQRLIAHLQARQAADLAELSGNYPGIREFLPTELALALHIAESTADKQLSEATDLVHRLPATFGALDAGLITAVKAATIRVGTEGLDPDLSAAVEDDVLPRAADRTVPQLRDAVRRSILARDPAGSEDRYRGEQSRRRISTHPKPDGMAGLWVYAAAQDIAAVQTCLTALGAAARTPDDLRTADNRRVDALVDICTDILDSGSWHGTTLRADHRRRPHIQVTVPITALLPGGAGDACPAAGHGTCITGGEAAELAGYGPISPAQARAITADGTLRRLVCDPVTGTLLDYGRSTYTPPAALTDHVLARDRTCVLPGCRQPAHLGELDHIRPYHPGRPDGGATSADNLAVSCKHHHRAKDGGEYRLSRTADGYRWTTPLGRTYVRPPTRLWEPPPPRPPDGSRCRAAVAEADAHISGGTPAFAGIGGAGPPY